MARTATNASTVRTGTSTLSIRAPSMRTLQSPPHFTFTVQSPSRAEGCLDSLGRERNFTNSHASRIEQSVTNRCCDHRDGRLASAGCFNPRTIDQHAFDHRHIETKRQAVVGLPVDRGHAPIVPRDFFPESPAQPLDRCALDLMAPTL